jgi:hypothetical protein
VEIEFEWAARTRKKAPADAVHPYHCPTQTA